MKAKWKLYVAMLALALTTGAPQAVATVVFDDGQTHNVDGDVEDDVDVRDDFFGNTTTVNLKPGGNISYAFLQKGDLRAYEKSHVIVCGGAIAHYLYAYDTSHVTLSSGSIGSYGMDRDGRLICLQESQVTVSGGEIRGYLYAYDNSQVVVSAGLLGRSLQAFDNAHVDVWGGSIDGGVAAYGDSQVSISGGSIKHGSSPTWALIAWHNSRVTVSGGLIDGIVRVGKEGETTTSVMIFEGGDFAINGTPVGWGEYGTGGRDFVHGTLTGTLANGDSLDSEFYIYGDSRIVLTPEPATLSLLALGGLALVRRRKRGMFN